MRILLCTFGSVLHYACRLFYSLLSDKSDMELLFFNDRWDAGAEKFLNDYMGGGKPDLVAVSLLTYEMGLCGNLSEFIRGRCGRDETKIIFGGPHAFLAPDQCLKAADLVCTGEGEQTLLELVAAFQNSGKWEDVHFEDIVNIAFSRNGETALSSRQDFHNSRDAIDDLPFPAFCEPGIFIYSDSEFRPDDCSSVTSYYCRASRGCPNKCSYCINSTFSRRLVTFRSPRKVIEELRQAKQKFPNLANVCFLDEIFCTRKDWLLEFSELYAEHIALPFECESFPGRHSEETIATLAKIGLQKISVGIQSCSPRILSEVYGRPQKTQDILDDNKMYLAHGVYPTYDFIVDNPFETPEELLETVETASRLRRPTFFRIYSLYFFPHYPITRKAIEEGIINSDFEMDGFYDKITTTHSGDQYSRKDWYAHPWKSLRNGDRKTPLNWLLTLYGSPTMPKVLTNLAFRRYKEGDNTVLLCLSSYYRLIDIARNNRFRDKLKYASRMLRQRGVMWVFTYAAKKMRLFTDRV